MAPRYIPAIYPALASTRIKRRRLAKVRLMRADQAIDKREATLGIRAEARAAKLAEREAKDAAKAATTEAKAAARKARPIGDPGPFSR